MNDLSLSVTRASRGDRNCTEPIPRVAIYILISLFLLGFGVSIFILVVVHNFIFFLSFLFLSAIVVALVVWNILSYRRNAALLFFLQSSCDSDLRFARHGQLVKITGPVSCGNVSLESSYEKVGECVYTSTLLYEYEGFRLKALTAKAPCFSWRLAYSERFSTDFYIYDRKSGIRSLVKAEHGHGRKLIPLIVESRLVNTSGNRFLSPNLIKWLTDRNLSAESRLIRLEEGYIKEGDSVSVIGMLYKGEGDVAMIVQPPELISTGCQWQRLLLPVDFDGLLLGTPRSH
ncbi:hypothetical protein Cgig2_017314 [Carnegiea gigantea]|uniref:Uncharacterized protein n=1 Tax=Carnegiea gigantea TaxID=171969 RepID=A0A9Q1QCQ3_9CARY|nr:hypothetical protein Cgig2_017314 [Carnegiea gigantea]